MENVTVCALCSAGSSYRGTHGVLAALPLPCPRLAPPPLLPTMRYELLYVLPIGTINKDRRHSISAILTWVPENKKISARPLNSMTSTPLDRFAVWLKKVRKKTMRHNFFLTFMKTGDMYLLAAMYGLTAINTIFVAG